MSIHTIEHVFDALTLMTDSDGEPTRALANESSDEIKASLLKSFSLKLTKVSETVGSLGGEINSESQNVSQVYLQTLLTLLKHLNRIVHRLMGEFDKEEQGKDNSKLAEKGEHSAPRLSPDVLSIAQQATLKKVYQFVVTLGVIPHLDDYVGIPISSRSKYGSVVSSLVVRDADILGVNIDLIIGLIEPTNVRAIFMSRHLNDLLAALIQLSYSSSRSAAAGRYRAALEQLIDRSYPPLIVRELLTLQGAAGRQGPLWLRAACGHYLTRILTSRDGVKSVVGGMITSDTDDWRKFVMAGRVIATTPKNWTDESYLQLIAPQVLSLLDNSDQILSRQYGRVVSAVMSAVGSRSPDYMTSMMWDPLTAGLHSSNETEQEKALCSLYKVVCCGAEPQSALLSRCLAALPNVFSIYMARYDSVIVTDSRLYCEELITTCLQFCDSQSSNDFLINATFCSTRRQSAPEDLTAEDKRIAAVQFVLSKIKDSSVTEAYFIRLLQELTAMMVYPPSDADSADPLTELDRSLEDLKRRYRLMSVLSSLCDTHNKACLRQPQHVIRFVKSTLTHFLSTTSTASAATMVIPDTEALNMSLSLLAALLSGAADVKLSESDLELLSQLDEPLNQISLIAGIPDDVKDLSLNLRVAITTQGLVWLNKTNSTSQSKTMKMDDNSKPSEQTPEAAGAPTPYHQALVELADPLIAVKGHALIQLTRLIRSGEKTTLMKENRVQLQTLLVEHLSHTDSYVYLSAITALSALSDRFPLEVLPVLCQQFGCEHLVAETRLKVGEVITKAARNLGDLAAAYCDLILPTVLIGCKSKDDLLRASSLVNLGEVCKLLQYSLGHYVQEVMECLSACVTDSSCESASRGAAYSLQLILSGLKGKSFDIMGGECLSKVYKALKRCAQLREADDVTLHHCAKAIEALDAEVKGSLFADRPLEKRIYVLDAPPS